MLSDGGWRHGVMIRSCCSWQSSRCGIGMVALCWDLHLQPDGLFFVLSTLSAFAANTWIVRSAFDRDLSADEEVVLLAASVQLSSLLFLTLVGAISCICCVEPTTRCRLGDIIPQQHAILGHERGRTGVDRAVSILQCFGVFSTSRPSSASSCAWR